MGSKATWSVIGKFFDEGVDRMLEIMKREETEQDRRPRKCFPEKWCEGERGMNSHVRKAEMCYFVELPCLHRYCGVVPSLFSLISCCRHLLVCGIRVKSCILDKHPTTEPHPRLWSSSFVFSFSFQNVPSMRKEPPLHS